MDISTVAVNKPWIIPFLTKKERQNPIEPISSPKNRHMHSFWCNRKVKLNYDTHSHFFFFSSYKEIENTVTGKKKQRKNKNKNVTLYLWNC
jgi:hypothetical protein